jgi:hypothetical protein
MRKLTFTLLIPPLLSLTFAQTQSSITINGIESIPNRPFLADYVVTQSNSATFTATLHAARDSRGRIRAESPRFTTPRAPAAAPFVFLYDPATGTSYLLDPTSRAAQATHPGKPRAVLQPTSLPPRDITQSRGPIGAKSLGTRIMDHLTVEGTRTTSTLQPSEAGNSHTVVLTDERWYSPGLHIYVLTRSHDPRTGETTRRFTHIQPIEPPASLFALPPGYNVTAASPAR